MSDRIAVMVHGAGGGAWEWNVWREGFAAHGWRVLAVELVPGAAGLEGTTLEDYREQVRRVVADVGDEGCVLIGASLGGLLAAMVVGDGVDSAGVEESRPRRRSCDSGGIAAPRALVLINPMPPAPLHLRLSRRDSYGAIVPWGRDASPEGTRRAMPDADDAACLYAFRRWRDESGAVMNAALAGVAVQRPACPVLVIASERDDDVPADASRELAAEWGGDFVRVPGASHVGPLLGASAAGCAEMVVAWLAVGALAHQLTRHPEARPKDRS